MRAFMLTTDMTVNGVWIAWMGGYSPGIWASCGIVGAVGRYLLRTSLRWKEINTLNKRI